MGRSHFPNPCSEVAPPPFFSPCYLLPPIGKAIPALQVVLTLSPLALADSNRIRLFSNVLILLTAGESLVRSGKGGDQNSRNHRRSDLGRRERDPILERRKGADSDMGGPQQKTETEGTAIEMIFWFYHR